MRRPVASLPAQPPGRRACPAAAGNLRSARHVMRLFRRNRTPPRARIASRRDAPTIADELEQWLRTGDDTSLGGLVAVFGEKSFALVFVLLLGVPALPLPTGGATHVFELIAMLLALELIAGRSQVWLPRRWTRLETAGRGRRRFLHGLLGLIRRLERISRPRLRFLFDHR